MASAVAQQNAGLTPRADGFSVDYSVAYAGTDVPNGSDYSAITVSFAYTDTPNDMTTKIGNAVRAEASRLGYTVGSNAVITNGFTKA